MSSSNVHDQDQQTLVARNHRLAAQQQWQSYWIGALMAVIGISVLGSVAILVWAFA